MQNPTIVDAHRIDSIIFGYFQRMGYTRSIEALATESVYLSTSQRKIQIGGEMVISVNDRVHEKTLEEIVMLFIQDARFDVNREMLEFGQQLRHLAEVYTNMTMLPSVSRSDNHQRLYGKVSQARHSQPTGMMGVGFPVGGGHRTTNFSTFTVQQSAEAKAYQQNQILKEQAEARYRMEQEQQRQQQQNFGSAQQTSENGQIPQAVYQQHQHQQQLSHFDQQHDLENGTKSSSSLDVNGGSSRRKTAHPQNFNEKIKEAVVQPLVGYINEKPWDSVSDIDINDDQLMQGLDVIQKDFLVNFDYAHAEMDTSRISDDPMMPLGDFEQIDATMMDVENEIEINGFDQTPQKIKEDLAKEMPALELKTKLFAQSPQPLLSPIQPILGLGPVPKEGTPSRRREDKERLSTPETSNSLVHIDEKEKNKAKTSKHASSLKRERNSERDRKDRRNGGRGREGEGSRRIHDDERRSSRSSSSPFEVPSSRRGSDGSVHSMSSGQKRRDETPPRRDHKVANKKLDEQRLDKRNDKSRNESSRKTGETERKRSPSRTPEVQQNRKESSERNLKGLKRNEPAVKVGTTKSKEVEKQRKKVDYKTTPPNPTIPQQVMKTIDSKQKLMNKLRTQNRSTVENVINESPEESKKPVEEPKKSLKTAEGAPPPPIHPWKIPKKTTTSYTQSPPPSIVQPTVSTPPIPRKESSKRMSRVASPSSPIHHAVSATPATPTIAKKEAKMLGPLVDGDDREDKCQFLLPKMTTVRLCAMLVNTGSRQQREEREEMEMKAKGEAEEKRSKEPPMVNTASSSEGSSMGENQEKGKVAHCPKKMMFAPQKVNMMAKNSNENDSDDEENEKGENVSENSSSSDSENEGEHHAAKRPKWDPVDMGKAADLLDKLHGKQ